jgi:hypothetical protein
MEFGVPFASPTQKPPAPRRTFRLCTPHGKLPGAGAGSCARAVVETHARHGPSARTSAARPKCSLASCGTSIGSAGGARAQRTCSFMARRKPLCWSSNPFFSEGLHARSWSSFSRRHRQTRRHGAGAAAHTHLCTEIVLRKATSSSVGNFLSCQGADAPAAPQPVTFPHLRSSAASAMHATCARTRRCAGAHLPKLHAGLGRYARAVRQLLQDLAVCAVVQGCRQLGVAFVHDLVFLLRRGCILGRAAVARGRGNQILPGGRHVGHATHDACRPGARAAAARPRAPRELTCFCL